VPVDLGNGRAKPACGRGEVDFGLDHDPAGDDVQSAGEAEDGRHFSLADGGLLDVQPGKFFLD
jgi:hypothetical protein